MSRFRWMILILILALGCGTEPAGDDVDATSVEDSGTEAADAGTTATDTTVTDSQITHDVVDDGPDGRWVHFSEPGPVPEYQQRSGDPQRGYDVLVNEGYVSCGIPWRIYDELLGWRDVPSSMKLPGRRGKNADLPYYYTAFDRNGVELVSTNCMRCHAKVLDGEVYVGLGDEGDYTSNLGAYAKVGRALVEGEAELAEYDRWQTRVETVQPHILTDTIGVNPADNLTGVLMAHRDPYTWEWQDEPMFDVPSVDPIPLSVPPWWHYNKKNALYYTALGRGDHARFDMAATLLCTDSLEEAREIDEMFVDVHSYLETIEAPEYPYAVDQTLAQQGEELFEDNCARCHGTYGADETYPNLVVGLDEVGTDPVLATAGALAADDVIEWFNKSFFGEVSTAAPARGYIAPPLDGIWVTAPYFHNASVPTIEAVLDPTSRPKHWTRDFDRPQLDRQALGLVHEELSYGKDGAENGEERERIYDTTLLGYSNVGHTFGAELAEDDRRALIEYLKTL